jgi:arylsulfatase A-like enzyme
VAPTILEIAGLQREPRFLGSSLVPLMKADTTASEPVLSEDSSATNELTISPERQVISVRTPKWKYIHYAYKDPELYDLTTDPQEKINLARTRPHEEKYFRTIVLKHIETRYGRRPESEKERLKKGIAALIGKKKI